MMRATRTTMRRRASSEGVALIMVLIVLSTLAVIGTPFVLSMVLRDRASQGFAGKVRAYQAAVMARNHAIARLEETSYPEELAREWEAVSSDEERSRLTPARSRTSSSEGGGLLSRPQTSRGSMRDVEGLLRRAREVDLRDPKNLVESLRELALASSQGASAREVDDDGELDVRLPDSFELPVAAEGLSASRGVERVRFRDPAGLTASAIVEDEQGKIHLDTAPPTLLGNLFGVTQLKEPLAFGAREIIVDDTTPFRGDADASTIDGALVIVHPETGVFEAVTYARKLHDRFADVFRGDLLSVPRTDEFPIGSFVWDLRGIKVAFHRFWSDELGSFHAPRLSRFPSIEAIRDVASWQCATLFAGRILGIRIGRELLDEVGISARRLESVGLEPWLFEEEIRSQAASDEDLSIARRVLRRLRVRSADIRKIEEGRGPRVLIDLASRLEGAGRKEVEAQVGELVRVIDAEKTRSATVDPKWLETALERLEGLSDIAGLETILPGELESLRDAVTVSSSIDGRWSEPQAILSDLSPDDRSQEVRVARVSELNRGTVVRIERIADEEKGTTAASELNMVVHADGAGEGGIRLLFPPLAEYTAGNATIQALERHPINVNTASLRVLRAVFTGVAGPDTRHAVTPYEADALATLVMRARPLRGPMAFWTILERARQTNVIDDEDVLPLWINSVQPTHSSLRGSTTGFVYRTGDVYTIESHGILRLPSGRELASARLREIVDVSPSGTLAYRLFTQRDFSEGIWFRDPRQDRLFPESHDRFFARFPGTRSHLVVSRPLPLERVEGLSPGGDRGNLRLRSSRLDDPAGPQSQWILDEVEHFDDYPDGLELAHGESYPLPIALSASFGPAGGGASPGAGGGTQPLDLIQVPGGLEFWLRMTTYPSARSEDGYVKIFEAGPDPERNKISLLYDGSGARVLLRIRDGSGRDPSVLENRLTGQYLQIEANRPLDLHTWYHFRVMWDGVFAGGAQLWIDGIPAGRDNLSTTLQARLPASDTVTAISVEDASRFPIEGVVKIGAELIEFQRAGDRTLTIRREPKRLAPLQSGVPPVPGLPGVPGVPGGAAPVAPVVPELLMRGPWTGRGSILEEHEVGARVSLWGYALELRRKIWDPLTRMEVQVSDNSGPGTAQAGGARGSAMVFGRGGLRLAEPLPAYSFPPGVSLVHYVDLSVVQDPAAGQGGGVQPPGTTPGQSGRRNAVGWLVPMFSDRTSTPLPGCESPQINPRGERRYRAALEEYGRHAIDYFQSEGILVYDDATRGTIAVRYRKDTLPSEYTEAHRLDRCRVPQEMEQTIGLRIEGDWPPSGSVPGLTGTGGASIYEPLNRTRITPVSLLATGEVEGLYPPTGVLEVEGSPTPWDVARGAPDLRGQDLFLHHPDDRVEWIRYGEVHGRLIIGKWWMGHSTNFRSYPSRAGLPGRQFDHLAGEGLRLVAELSEGGAGYGDYVTITSRNGGKQESKPRRVYKVLEHRDGRFFASLVEVNERGQALHGGTGAYEHDYYRSEDPRLVKFPSWNLPSLSAGGTLTFFGDATIQPSRGAGSSASGGPGAQALSRRRALFAQEDDDSLSATILDEIKRFQTPLQYLPNASFGSRVRYALVPLNNGRVEIEPQGGISGRIGAGDAISRSNPREVYIVAITTERGLAAGALFGQGLERGLVRIGEELFFFEDPEPQAAPATGRLVPNSGATYNPPLGGAGATPVGPVAGDGRGEAFQDSFQLSGIQNGRFEPQGFVRIEDGSPERASFYETVFYRDLAGGQFGGLLRGRFHTPILSLETASQNRSRVVNVTKRVRLIGRALLGTQATVHELGDPVTLVPWVSVTPIVGPMTASGLPVLDSSGFSRRGGYVLVDSTQPGRPFEILPYLRTEGPNLLRVPRDERGELCLRGSFGTPYGPIGEGAFAWELPFRHYDRYAPETESESLAYFQRSFRAEGARWVSLSWRERPWRSGRERLADVVVAARFDREADWSAKPKNEPGSLYLFEKTKRARGGEDEPFVLDRVADELEIRIYFRYRPGAFQRVGGDVWNDDWKETPVLEELTIEYEKDGAIVRHEELPF